MNEDNKDDLLMEEQIRSQDAELEKFLEELANSPFTKNPQLLVEYLDKGAKIAMEKMKENNKDETRETVRDTREQGDDLLMESPSSLEEEGEILMRVLRENPPLKKEELWELIQKNR